MTENLVNRNVVHRGSGAEKKFVSFFFFRVISEEWSRRLCENVVPIARVNGPVSSKLPGFFLHQMRQPLDCFLELGFSQNFHLSR